MPDIERAQAIQDQLQKLRGTEPLRRLFWTELNYQRINQSLPRRGWPEAAATALAEDPVLFAKGGEQFEIIYARLASDKLFIENERHVTTRLLRDHPYALFIFSNAQQNRWHFLNVKYDDDVQKRRLFRRITVGPDERLRTASERLSMLDLSSVGADLFGLSPLEIQKRHDEAFDVEPVTQEFFREYARVFGDVEASIGGIRDTERKRLFTQRLFNRLMFVAFIQKKGWLKFDGHHDYLWAVWDAHKKDKKADKNFYLDRIKPLFFLGLNTTDEIDKISINRGGFLATLIGHVPYLNGGLFEEDEDDKDPHITVPDGAADAILNELFGRFNFTITESTPLDVEVAVDPEMLGKIFEELVTGRHGTGSYYTPKPVVSFMCREALKGYLGAQLRSESLATIERLVDEHDASTIRDAEAALDAMRRVTICDPACGSGAYLLGMLHELLDLRAALFVTKKIDALSIYDRKLEIIQRNLYGVDNDPFAVNIARLRLWLSLSVDFEGPKPEPLPNLDYKVETGDSIAGPNPSGGLEQGFRQALVHEFLGLKGRYLMAHGPQKIELRNAISKLRETIAGWAHGSSPVRGFDWPVEFAEVFAAGGFDVVVSNPPYVRIQELTQTAPKMALWLKDHYQSAAKGNYDLYVVFVERGLQLLSAGGEFAYILPHKFFNAQYGEGLRGIIARGKHLRRVIHFGDLQVFSTATNYVCLMFLRREPTSRCLWEKVANLNDWFASHKAAGVEIPTRSFSEKPWNIAVGSDNRVFEAMRCSPLTVGEVARHISQGIRTSANEIYVLDVTREDRTHVHAWSESLNEEVALDCRSVSRFLQGRDMRRYGLRKPRKVVIIPYRLVSGRMELIPPKDYGIMYPSTWAYLRRNKKALEAREKGRMVGDGWYGYIYPKNLDIMRRAKLLVPDTAARASFAYDELGEFTFTSGYGITLKTEIGLAPEFVVGVLNSALLDFFWKKISTPLRGGYFRYFTQFIDQLPLPKLNLKSPGERSEHDAIVELSKSILRAKRRDIDSDTSDFENEIDDRIFKLFDVSRAYISNIQQIRTAKA